MEELKDILTHNFAHLGFKLTDFEVDKGQNYSDTIVRGVILCPCGGTEYFAFRLTDEEQISHPAWATVTAKRVLSQTASEKHLKEDVEQGLLPAFDYQKHIFKGLV